jgi:hypothetical protein
MPDVQAEYLDRLKAKFGSYLDRYGKPSIEERQALRCTEPNGDLIACHRLVSEELDHILEVLDQYNYDEVPREWQSVANLVLCLAEIDSPVVKWIPRFGLAHLPDAVDPRYLETKRNFYDSEPANGKTLLADRIR